MTDPLAAARGGRTSSRKRVTLAALAACCVVVAGPQDPRGKGSASTPDVKDRVDSTRAALEKWVENRRLIAKERSDWRLGKELLLDRAAMMEREIETLRGRIADAEKNLTESDRERADLQKDLDKLLEASDGLKATVVDLEARTKKLLKRLPAPILDKIKPITQRLPEDPETTEASLSDRFVSVISILNEVNKFANTITIVPERHELSADRTAEVTVMYVGISQAYYVTKKADAAAIGTVSDDAWVWIPANEYAPRIARAIEILNKKEKADFVHLPVRIR